MLERPVGIIANPASGKDIRRLVARASVFDNQEKAAIVRRAIAGAIAAGTTRFHYLQDDYGIVQGAADELAAEATFVPFESPGTNSALDTIRAARALCEAGCGAVITLGGDGTNRAVALGWRDAPLVAISTGTNNVFPRMVEATVAGAAAGLVATGAVPLEEVSRRAKVVVVEIDGEKDDLALIDAVVLDERFVGAKAVWNASHLRVAVLARAEPASVGFSSLGGLLRPVGAANDAALAVTFGEGGDTVYAPIAPGLYRDVAVQQVRTLALDEVVEVEGPAVIAVDGERERVLKPGQQARLRVVRDGPRVIDVERTMQHAACRGLFRTSPGGSNGD